MQCLILAQGYLGDCLSRQCNLIVVGLEREEVRVQASKERVGGGGRKEVAVESLTSHSREEAFVVSDTSGHVTGEWEKQLQECLPQQITAPCKVSLSLNVSHSAQTLSKLTYLLDYLEST